METFEVRVKARIYHGLLSRIVDENGGVASLAKQIGISGGTVGAWLRMKHSPVSPGKRPSRRTVSAVKKLCRIGKCKAKDIWPEWFGDLIPAPKTIDRYCSVEPAAMLGWNRIPVAALPAPEDRRQELDAVKETVGMLMTHLPERLQKVVQLRSLDGLTFEEVGQELGVSKERVRQLEVRAHKKMANVAILLPEVADERQERRDVEKKWALLDKADNQRDAAPATIAPAS